KELQDKAWKIANEVRGLVDGWDFKQYVLGALFYQYISEDFSLYMKGGDESIDYARLSDDAITPEIKDDTIKTKGYFIYPSQLFVNVVANADNNPNLNTDLVTIFTAIENSANGYPSEPNIKGIFSDFNTTSNILGNTVTDKNNRLNTVLKGIDKLKLDQFQNKDINVFGNIYSSLISDYAANSGKAGGELLTPSSVSKLIMQLATHKQDKINKVYDPACGVGSLLLQAKKLFDTYIIEDGFWGQEISHTTYNLARMNMLSNDINYDKFNIKLGNTLINPYFNDDEPFDVIVSNPPYSFKWIGNDDPALIDDERFAPAGVLAPKSKADFAFVLHALSYLSNKGRAFIVCFPAVFYRGGVEQKIREYLIKNNYIESIISLSPNLLYGTSIPINILVLSKHKINNKVQFIDASKLFKPQTKINILANTHIEKIIKVFNSKVDMEYFSTSVDNAQIIDNDYNLSVSSYVKDI
ncbi:MAG: type I restriction-modification system subunit M, partial [Clostridiales bacterium]|nr:type I restriction-modification system subunit M [Clostridiales bacterium]